MFIVLYQPTLYHTLPLHFRHLCAPDLSSTEVGIFPLQTVAFCHTIQALKRSDLQTSAPILSRVISIFWFYRSSHVLSLN